jgi:hypothetical protein
MAEVARNSKWRRLPDAILLYPRARLMSTASAASSPVFWLRAPQAHVSIARIYEFLTLGWPNRYGKLTEIRATCQRRNIARDAKPLMAAAIANQRRSAAAEG